MVQFYSCFFLFAIFVVPRHIHIGDHLLNLLLLWFETQGAHCDLRWWRLSQPSESDAQVHSAMVRWWWWGCRWCWWCWGFASVTVGFSCPFSRCDIRFRYWLVVDLPLWKIWKSVGSIIPNIWKITAMFQTTNRCIRYIRYQAISRPDMSFPFISHLRRSTEEKTRNKTRMSRSQLLGPTKRAPSEVGRKLWPCWYVDIIGVPIFKSLKVTKYTTYTMGYL